MPPLPENFWRWTTSGLLAALLALLTLSWQASRHEHEALGQMADWTNKAQDGRLDRLELRQDDVRKRLSELESKYTYETLATLVDLRKRLERLESRGYAVPVPPPP